MAATAPARLVAHEKQRKAVALRQAGLTYAQIAKEVGYSHASAAHKAVTSMLRQNMLDSTNEFRQVQFGRLDYMIQKLWARVADGDERAIMSVAQLMAQQDKLMGTEAPTEHKVTHAGAVLVIDGSTEDEYVDQLEKMAAQSGAAPINHAAAEDIEDAVVIEDEDQLELVADTEPPCPRYVLPADPERAANGLCARCPHTKDEH